MKQIVRFRLSEENVTGLTLCPHCTEDLRETVLESWVAHGFDRVAPFRVMCPGCCRMYRVSPNVTIDIVDREELPEEHCWPEHPDDCIDCPQMGSSLERCSDNLLRYRRGDK